MNDEAPSSDTSAAVLDRLFAVIDARRDADPQSSYTAQLLAGGESKIARKFGEEAIETLVASMTEDSHALATESADLLYHLLVLWAAKDVRPADVWQVLMDREGTSGIEEKAARSD